MLYEKYRPKMFKDVIGQGANGEILKKQVESQKIAHTYLFGGNRGSGKTTSARILAKAINCEHPINGEPCGTCANCIAIEEGKAVDVIEIDAASNNGVEQVREIITDMRYAPTTMKYKVYIIDEAHMLSKSASNAFLKTLEEPPAYGVFILCTTEQTALPITILSRCQKYNFKHIDVTDIYKRIDFIATNEGYNPIEKNKILTLIAKMADGAVRDAISLLEQVINGNITTYQEVVNLLGVVSNRTIFELLAAINKGNSKHAIDVLYKVLESGVDIEKFLTNTISLVRSIMLIKAGASSNLLKMSEEDINIARGAAKCFDNDSLFKIIENINKVYSEVKVSNFKGVLVEMAIMKIIEEISTTSKSNIVQQTTQQAPAANVDIEAIKLKLRAEIEAEYTQKFQEALPKIEEDLRKKITIEVSQEMQKSIEKKKEEDLKRATNLNINNAIKAGQKKLVDACNGMSSKNQMFQNLANAFEKAGFLKQNGTDNVIRVCANKEHTQIITMAFEVKELYNICNSFFVINNVQYVLKVN
ncbi:DNA polymerase III subunit gamma/tau (plasmid) [Clostridium perfringens]|uniref:DNA polymerase III subunit gamma/tau n=1 Tax=Clostridium perfringens TaxID=1502 RepID=UPI000B389598|nr:DNA polymerase III subunit gamma/tau [Clostridium perfringens]EGT0690623.1 DNA polymerase III subunit gamma/tau [Clostridium perfringens]EGT0694086.1 DNA polymerase III subunit gamma/tau [Clostridium perfringens]EGT0697051.1 DNA polymerase III subunit gamma/tau [Clostridium perfringens]MDU3376254.1 DNA polymerase III subunit gamma/tau [Clostridium perfringens]MDU3534210.1 DNA polymerase III subunit gamma/tau [Clostridium perfringens]